MPHRIHNASRKAGKPVQTFVEGVPLTLHRSTGQCYFYLDDGSGRKRRFYQGPYYAPDGLNPDSETLDRSTRWLRAYKVLGGPPPRKQAATGITVRDLRDRFLSYCKRYYGEGSVQQQHFATALSNLAAYDDEAAASFGPLALRGVRDRMVESDRWNRKLINDYVRRIRQCFRWGVSHELIPVTVVQALSTVEGLRKGRTKARESKSVHPVPDKDVEAILTFLSRQLRAVVELLRLTGARPNEICSMRPTDIARTDPVWTYVPTTHKSSHRQVDRVIPLGPKAQEILAPFLLRGSDTFLFSPAEAEAERREARHQSRKTAMNCGNKPGSNKRKHPKVTPGDRYSPNSLRRAIRRACEKAGVDPWHPYQLRHARATALRRQFGLEAARVVLGHTDAGITAAYYAEQDKEQAMRIAGQVG